MGERPMQRVAIAGLGVIGWRVAEALNRGIEPFALTAVSANDRQKAESRLRARGIAVPVLAIDELEPRADMVIECVPAQLFRQVAEPFLKNGKTVMTLSCGALLANEDLVDLARKRGGQIVVPTGALIGLDAVTAAAEGQIHSVRMVTRKPVKSLLGAPYLLENGIDIESIQEPLRVFTGSAREAAVGFPANLNVAVALSLAGIGPDRTQIEVWADPALERNTHRIEVEADSARFSMEIANVPSENNRTGRITALSVISWLKKTSAPLRVGS
jgi:aspartate dehydrogenase